MSSGDGFAVKTTISQLGNVARSQQKAQQAVHQADGRRPGERESRVEQVRETEDAQKGKLDPDARKERKHQGRGDGDGPEPDENEAGRATDDAEDVGRLVDTRA